MQHYPTAVPLAPGHVKAVPPKAVLQPQISASSVSAAPSPTTTNHTTQPNQLAQTGVAAIALVVFAAAVIAAGAALMFLDMWRNRKPGRYGR